MKILFVLNSGFDTPGPSNHLLESIIEKIILDGDRVHIIEKHSTGENPDVPISIAENGNLSYDTCKVRNVKKMSFIKRYLADIKYAFSCIKHFKNNKNADVIFLQSCNTSFFHIFLLKLFINKPIIYNVQDIFPINAMMMGVLKEKGILYKILSYLQRCTYKKADKIITISEDMKKTLINEGVKDYKISVIHNWSYSDDIIEIVDKDNKFSNDYGIDNDKYKIVYAGNIGTMQNVKIIMEAAKLLKDEKEICFYIIGNGVMKEKYEEFAAENELKNVFFYPMQPSEYAPHIYSMADINIIPLNKGIIKTALPSKTATCLACGKPIIACVDKESYFSQIIGGCDKCSVIDSNDSEGLANCIKRYYDYNIRERSIEERELFKICFSKQRNVRAYVNMVRELVKDSEEKNINRYIGG